jgi:hypothetical protein
VLEKAIKQVSEIRGSLPFPDDFFQDNSFEFLVEIVEEQLSSIALDRSPGYPLNLQFSTNKQALENMREEIVLCAVARLFLWTNEVSSRYAMTIRPLERVLLGFVDPANVFVKEDPHPLRKVVKQAYRCISAVSLIDNFVESSLFAKSSKLIREVGKSSGSAVGIGFTDEMNEDNFEFFKTMKERFKQIISLDGSGFDAWHTPQILQATLSVDVIVHSPNPLWIRAASLWVVISSESVVVIAGILYIRVNPGTINTGSKDTSRRNTLLASLYACVAGIIANNPIDFVYANGDDALIAGGPNVLDLTRAYASFGATVRDVVECHDRVEFCSHEYQKRKGRVYAALSSWPKALYSTFVKDTNISDVLQIAYELRDNDENNVHDKFMSYAAITFPQTFPETKNE